MAKIILLHGRFQPDEEFEDGPQRCGSWGFAGPTIYGVAQVARIEKGYVVTFLSERLCFRAQQQTGWDAVGPALSLQLLMPLFEDMITSRIDLEELLRSQGIDAVPSGFEVGRERGYFGDWSFDATTFSEKYFHEREAASLQLQAIGAGDRVNFLRQLGNLVRPFAPFAADELESYEEGFRFNPSRSRRR